MDALNLSVYILLGGMVLLLIIRGFYDNIRNLFRCRKPKFHKSSMKKLQSETFNTNKYKDFCGVEIECIESGTKIRDRDSETMYFQKGSDGSLSDKGVEFRSYPSQGDTLFNQIDTFCKALRENKYSVDTSCGLHIHIETEPQLELLKKIYCFYNKYEDLFFKMLPKSRLNNSYCSRFNLIDEYDVNEILKQETMFNFLKTFYETYGWNVQNRISSMGSNKRYCWINFHSIFNQGTLEIRAHSGTTNARKIKNWITIHLTIMNYLKTHSLKDIDKLSKEKDFLRLFDKKIQGYIKERWSVFPKVKESEYKEVK